MDTDAKLALYFLDLHASDTVRNYVSPAEKHLNECADTVVSDVEVLAAPSATHPTTYLSAHFHCQHGWGTPFESYRFGYADGYRESASSLIEG